MSKERFPSLFRPLQIAGRTLKNRVFQTPMSVSYADHEGYVTPALIEHYGRRAQGGVAMVMTENVAVSVAGRQLPKQPLISDERFLPGLTKLASEIKKHGALAVIQIVHAGRYAGPWEEYEQRRRLSPSALPFPLTVSRVVTPQEITREEMQETIEAFGTAAVLAKRAGFDGVEIHGAQGFLLSAFVSPHMNHRTDEYGGRFENRIRFPLEVVKEVMDRVGQDLLVGYHMLSDELLLDGWTLEESRAFAKRLEEEHVHFLIPVTATFESLKRPENNDLMSRTMFEVAGSAALKQVVDIPVLVHGRLGDPYVAEHVLAHGEADAIGLARPLFTDPDWVNKVESGRLKEIRTCPCDPSLCLQTQLTGSICSHWPEDAIQRGYLGYSE